MQPGQEKQRLYLKFFFIAMEFQPNGGTFEEYLPRFDPIKNNNNNDFKKNKEFWIVRT